MIKAATNEWYRFDSKVFFCTLSLKFQSSGKEVPLLVDDKTAKTEIYVRPLTRFRVWHPIRSTVTLQSIHFHTHLSEHFVAFRRSLNAPRIACIQAQLMLFMQKIVYTKEKNISQETSILMPTCQVDHVKNLIVEID